MDGKNTGGRGRKPVGGKGKPDERLKRKRIGTDQPEKGSGLRKYKPRPRTEGRDEERPSRPRPEGRGDDRPSRSASGRKYTPRPRPEGKDEDRPRRSRAVGEGDEKRSRPGFKGTRSDEKRPFRGKEEGEKKYRGKSRDFEKKPLGYGGANGKKGRGPSGKRRENSDTEEKDGSVRLNKYIADSGLCSRREADTLITTGAVKVNGEIVTVLGTKVKRTDKVAVGDQTLTPEKLRYVLLNKPKNYITTMDDPEGRSTVAGLVANACKERIYPVGRLDRNTTGLLLFTNDGELTKKLTHPSHNIRKVYHVVLKENLKMEDFRTIEQGLELEDGFIKVDAIDYVGAGSDRNEVGIEIHSGKNRIVRRIFEHLGYDVEKLDRVAFGGLTKKDLPRGKWRLLTPEEINFLKML